MKSNNKIENPKESVHTKSEHGHPKKVDTLRKWTNIQIKLHFLPILSLHPS